MNDLRVLMSGDYWHHEFQSIVANFPTPVTLTPVDRLEPMLDQDFDLIVLAQSRPDQISAELVERIQAKQPTTPVVALLGSWCEGGMRSDVPWPGVRRVYWHQWEGRFEDFSGQLDEDGLALWHQPGTANDADDAMLYHDHSSSFSPAMLVAVSAASQTQFEYVRDVLKSFGWNSCWAERANFDQETVDLVSALCIEANSFSGDLANRVDWLRSKLPGVPTSLVLNFPRSQDVAAAGELGIENIVSKPFQPADLKHAIQSSIARQRALSAGKTEVPAAHFGKSVASNVD